MFFLHMWTKSPPTTQNSKIRKSAKNSVNAPPRNETGRSPSCPQTTPVDDITERLRSSLHFSGLESVVDSVSLSVPKPRVPGQLGLQGAASGLEVARVPGRTAVLRVKAADGPGGGAAAPLRGGDLTAGVSFGAAKLAPAITRHILLVLLHRL